MINTYTYFWRKGNFIHTKVKEVGEYKLTREYYSPTLYVPCDHESKYKTTKGVPLRPIQFQSMFEAQQTIREKEAGSVFGYPRFEYTYINETFGCQDLNSGHLNVGNFDIEVYGEHQGRFPSPQEAAFPVSGITIKRRGKTFVLGCQDYEPGDRPDTHYIKCQDEPDMLRKFVVLWGKLELDIITGWNCIPEDSYVWKSNGIERIKNISEGDILCSSRVNKVFPASYKDVFEVKLSNGHKFKSSGDHVYPVVRVDDGKYTKLTPNNKNSDYFSVDDVPLKDIIVEGKSSFMEVPLHENVNEDVEGLSDDVIYTLGLIYTDGTISDKSNRSCGFKIYQSDENLLRTLDGFLSTSLVGPHKGCYSRRVKHSLIRDWVHLIYDENNNKHLNVEGLSKLSYRQWMLFLSGVLDGDGSISNNSISLCNYESEADLEALYFLCIWNGIFTTVVRGKQPTIRFIDFNFNDLRLRKVSRWGDFQPRLLSRTSSQKSDSTKYRRVGQSYFVRVESVRSMGEKTNMLDLSTDTGYFVYGGVRTHNCDSYDVPYIINRMKRLGLDEHIKSLSDWGTVEEREIEIYGNQEIRYIIHGVSILDYLDLYKKFTFKNRESYKLDHIGFVELGERKLDYSEYSSLDDLHDKNYQKYMDYNVRDVDLVDRLDEKLQLIDLVVAVAYMVGINFNDVYMQTRIWDTHIANQAKNRRNILVPSRVERSSGNVEGGYVKEPDPGVYEWVETFDVVSMYPSWMRTLNISPETLVDVVPGISREGIISGKCLEKMEQAKEGGKYMVAANGARFTKERGIIPELVEDFFQNRIDAKNEMKRLKRRIEELENLRSNK